MQIPLLVTSDKHLLDIGAEALLLALNEADLSAVHPVHPKRLLKALRSSFPVLWFRIRSCGSGTLKGELRLQVGRANRFLIGRKGALDSSCKGVCVTKAEREPGQCFPRSFGKATLDYDRWA